MRLRAAAAALTVTAALALSGCGGSSSTPDLGAGGDAKAATGPAVKGNGYEFHAPSHWKVPADKLGQTQADTLAVAPSGDHGFTPNINVVVQQGAGSGTPTDEQFTAAEKNISKALASAGGSDVHVQPRLDLDHETALHVTSDAKRGSTEYQLDQYSALHDGSLYTITISVPIGFQEDQLRAISQPTLASWSWQ